MAQLTEEELVLWRTRLANARAALDRLENGDQETSVSHGNDGGNRSMSFAPANRQELRQKIERLKWEIEHKCEQSFSHKPVTICN